MFGIDVIAAGLGYIIPPIFDMIKRFLPEKKQSIEDTLGTLATTKPEMMAAYIDSVAKLKAAGTAEFNQDVIGQTSTWVTNLRAVIRPVTVILCMSAWIASIFVKIPLQPEMAAFMSFTIGNWFGSRKNSI